MSKWIGGLAEWVDGDTAYLSIAFTWKIAEATEKAMMHSFQGRKVRAGGPVSYPLTTRTTREMEILIYSD